VLTEHNEHEIIYRKIQVRLLKGGESTRSALCDRIVNDTVVEVNIKYGGKYLDLIEIK